MRKILSTLAISSLFWAQAAIAETLTNDSIIMLSAAGLGSEAIIAKIKASAATFDLSTEKLIALKSAKVPDAVIAAMLETSSKPNVSANAAGTSNSADPLAPHASGIYLLRGTGSSAQMMRIDATNSAQTKTSGGLASAMTYGIAKRKIKTVLNNPNARLQVSEPRPTFYFYFDQAQSSLSQGGSSNPFAALMGGAQNPVTSPNEFTMLKFEISDNRRQVDLGSLNIGGLKMGTSDKQRVPFDYQDVAPGVFKVQPGVDLDTGEYGFTYTSAGGGSMMAMYGMGGQTTKIFDFGVKR
jgi:hypothetical protein